MGPGAGCFEEKGGNAGDGLQRGVWFNHLDPFAPRHQPVHLRKEGCFVGFCFDQFELEEGQAQLFVHESIIPHERVLCYNFCAVLPYVSFIRCCPRSASFSYSSLIMRYGNSLLILSISVLRLNDLNSITKVSVSCG